VTIKILSHELAQTCCEILIEDLADCQLFAEQVASLSTTPMAIALSGTLGAGKTQWTRFFAIALGAQPTSVSSPTFMLVHEYDSQPPIYHLDAYRIGDEDEMLELGIEEMLDADAITIVEWADRFPRRTRQVDPSKIGYALVIEAIGVLVYARPNTTPCYAFLLTPYKNYHSHVAIGT